MRTSGCFLGIAVLVLLSGTRVLAACDPSTDPDESDVANARVAVATQCACATSPTHGAYVSCAVQQANLTLVNKSCAGAVGGARHTQPAGSRRAR